MTFEEVVQFHGHSCPGLALGYRVTALVLKELGGRAHDEELVAIVENNSCAVDAVQAMAGCTFGKGNLIFKDYGKQAYTFIRRSDGEAVRISVKWTPPPDSEEEKVMWDRYAAGDRSQEVVQVVQSRKTRKMEGVLKASDNELFKVEHVDVPLPEPARIYKSVTCSVCGETVMEPKTSRRGEDYVCLPCAEKN